MAYVGQCFTKEIDLFSNNSDLQDFKKLFDEHFLLPIFDHERVLLDLYKSSSLEIQKLLYRNSSKNKKVSELLEKVFQEYKNLTGEIILRKGDFYKLIAFCQKEDIDTEVSNKLDEICKIIQTG